MCETIFQSPSNHFIDINTWLNTKALCISNRTIEQKLHRFAVPQFISIPHMTGE